MMRFTLKNCSESKGTIREVEALAVPHDLAMAAIIAALIVLSLSGVLRP